MNYFLKIYVFITVVIAAVSVASSSTTCSNYKINNLQADSSKYIIARSNPKFSWGSELLNNNGKNKKVTFRQEKFVISIVDYATSEAVWTSKVINSSKPVYQAPNLPISHFRKYTWLVSILDSHGCWTASKHSNLYHSPPLYPKPFGFIFYIKCNVFVVVVVFM